MTRFLRQFVSAIYLLPQGGVWLSFVEVHVLCKPDSEAACKICLHSVQILFLFLGV